MRQTSSYVIYSVDGIQLFMYENGIIWHPYEHIVYVLVHEDIDELPRSLVLPWWTKTAKVGLQNAAEFHWNSFMLSQYGCLMDWFRQLANFACQENERFIFI
ncbi:hypothetical protein Ahy_A08g038039 isoform B [Arachis hypogaea]|uniref:Uncharacterized protein n=1 Tax=Arachis hypogaea TaxID=3818 RepID=A0A445BSM4_ARAHY|nr:hypothetical protein Ahy_A08g038039 isoform B [Arachis hypogaea]